MAARDRNTRRRANRSAAFQDLAHDLGRQLAERHAENGERHDRFAAHGVNVGNGVGRGDAAEIEGIVHDRREEVGGGNDAGVGVDLPHRGVVAGLRSHQKLREQRGGGLVRQQLLQNRRRQLATAAAAMGETGQPNLRNVHGSRSPDATEKLRRNVHRT
jgi:hypothetical protein